MTLENFRYFLIAAEELNFTRAAQKLFITQQSLSGHIAKIEDYYGVKLFDRTAPMSITPEGKELTEHAKKLLGMADDIERKIRDMKDFKRGTLTVGITRVRGAIYLTSLLSRYRDHFPDIQIKLIEGSAPEIEDILHRAQADITIAAKPQNDFDVVSIPFWTEHIVAVVPQVIMDKQLKAHKDELLRVLETDTSFDWRILGDCPFIALSPQHQSGLPFYKICKELNITPNIVLEAETIDTLLRLCFDGMGVLVCPDIFLYPYQKIYKSKEHKVYIFPWKFGLSRDICINYLSRKYLPKSARELMDMILAERYLI